MKNLFFTSWVGLFLVIFYQEIGAQQNIVTLNQCELMKQWVGKWQRVNNPKDSIYFLEVKEYKKAFIAEDYYTINGVKNDLGTWSFGFSKKEDKFMIFGLRPGGNYVTRICWFENEKKLIQHQVLNFDPEKLIFKIEITFDSPKSWTGVFLNKNGVVTSETKFVKVE